MVESRIVTIPKGKHATEHETGGIDEIVVTGLVGAGDKGAVISPTDGGLAWLEIIDATLADFQANAGTGTFNVPSAMNDNNTSNSFDTTAVQVGKYGEVDFMKYVKIDQWRLYGHANNNGDGYWKLQYRNKSKVWVDWVLNIPTRNTNDWTTISVETEVIADAIRLECTQADSYANGAYGREIEVFHS